MCIFMGSTAKKLQDYGHHKVPGFGVFKEWARSDANLLLRKLILDQFLKEKVQINRAGMANVFIHVGDKSGKLLNNVFNNERIMLPLSHNPKAANVVSKVRKQTVSSGGRGFTYAQAQEDEYNDNMFDDSVDEY